MTKEIIDTQRELESGLWSMANALRGNMDANDFKNYILSMLFYYFLSEKEEEYMSALLNNTGLSFDKAWNMETHKDTITQAAVSGLGYMIKPEYLFRSLAGEAREGTFDVDHLQDAIDSLMESTRWTGSREAFDGLFDDMQLDSVKLGRTKKARTMVMANVITALDKSGLHHGKTTMDILGNAYEYMISRFAASAGKKTGEFYTPAGPAELLARLACDGLTEVRDVCDCCCGSGSLLLRLRKHVKIAHFWGEELSAQTHNLCRMNMILRGISYGCFHIYHDDTLINDRFGDKKFTVQVGNPPFSSRVQDPDAMKHDPRFAGYGAFVPKSKSDLAFLQHMVYHMADDGRIAVLLPQGVLFRGNGEETIRRHLIRNLNVVDAVIGLAPKQFYGTNLPAEIVVCRKDRGKNADNILFIDASRECTRVKQKNVLEEKHIDRIMEAYRKREDIERFAHVASMEEIEKNQYNLSISRYVDTSEPEPEISLSDIEEDIRRADKKFEEISSRLRSSFEELGLKFPC